MSIILNTEFTLSGARLRLFNKIQQENGLNYAFLPGGPGMGSESLIELVALLSDSLNDNLWLLDLPNDGSNRSADFSFSNWRQALIEVSETLPNLIFVGHSTGGMYLQSIPELENKISGLVLMDSAPDCSWQVAFEQYCNQHPIDGMENILQNYMASPNDEHLKQLTVISAPYCFAESHQEIGKQLFNNLPINHEATAWSTANFDNLYQANWAPKTVPTLIFSGELDKITPVSNFSQRKEYLRDNIIIDIVEKAAHFPWIENPEKVLALFLAHRKRL